MTISGTVNGVQNPGYRYDADGNLTCEYTGSNCSHGAITKETDAYWSFNMTHTIGDGATSLTLTGFTSRGDIASLCPVDLNARLCDPSIGWFLSADSRANDISITAYYPRR